MHTSLQGQEGIKTDILKKKIISNKYCLINIQVWTRKLNWSDREVKTKTFNNT